MSSSNEATTPLVDTMREQMLVAIQTSLGDALVESQIKSLDDLWIRVRTDSWRASVKKLRDVHGFDYFCFLSAIDWMPSPYGRGEDDPTEPAPIRDTTIRSGYAGGETRIQVFIRIVNSTTHLGITVKADVADTALVIESLITIFAGANWHEREAHEMFGIDFAGHPDLRNMYLPADFEGHPLRKDFPLLSRMVKPWPGIVDVEPLPASDEPASDEPADDLPTSGNETVSDDAS
ncbi:MAG: NADH-quinone oxidoreductase subunit C [Acidimicrobiaceae bacterium]|nr:NADH-quinone oxidoreductase subunit C [Acidimicrobiaceae bacterium]